MTQESQPASRRSREIAAQAWCEDSTKGIEMDPRLAEAFAQIIDRERQAGIVLTGHQLLAALDYTAPDRDTDPDQMDSELTIALGDETSHSGPGPYAWSTDYPEEGAIALFDAPEDASNSDVTVPANSGVEQIFSPD
ncbi:hypothetical protein [Herbaspirillum sp. CAH-3]|uniref:hypothetical protein n=1 Tax=Herbaspirillum sp. CAH-3 TaxID=2605746 RepID=UPI001E5ABA20|nr:hypothetical protein [Herbaspirillum sp. CAH-3]